MIQALVKKGTVVGEKVPTLKVSKGCLLIKVVNSCISAGTEMSGLSVSQKSLIRKALEKPELVIKALNMIRRDGVQKVHDIIKGKVDAGNPTGYSISGVVIGIGEDVDSFSIGDHVAASGAGIANHAEFVDVPINLAVKMPVGLDFQKASTVTLGGIAMQGVRRADLRLGEYGVVIGAGILGLLTVQMLKNSGIRVAAVDLDDRRLEIAKRLGAEIIINPASEDLPRKIEIWSDGFGADGVIFTAATPTSGPLSDAFKACRRKGKVILVGVAGAPMEVKREDIYGKELDFLVSTSYGPGRYDKLYEEKGLDYPYAYVRWTENRNMTDYLRMLKNGTIVLDDIIDKVFLIENVTDAFNSLKVEQNKPLMVLLDYGEFAIDQIDNYKNNNKKIITHETVIKKNILNIALVGAGGFATGMHLPNIKKLNNKFKLYAVVNRTGHKAKNVAKLFYAHYATTEVDDVLRDADVDLVLIATRHDSHGELVLKCLEAGKHVFVEKPLAVNQEELDAIKTFYAGSTGNKPVLFTGFNRRFSKYAQEIKKHTKNRINPLFIHYRMNAGFIPLDHWVHENGGRIVGEGCHIIDLMTFFTESKLVSINYESLEPGNKKYSKDDNKSIILKYEDGSVCTIEYFSVGNKEFAKENMEVHFDGNSIVLDDYKSLSGYGVKVKNISTPSSEKGQYEELEALYGCLTGKNDNWPIDLWDMIQTTEATFLIK